MAIYEFSDEGLTKLDETSLVIENIKERDDLQRVLRDKIETIYPGTLVISEEFGQWEDSSRRIDLLGLDKNANLVVFELKRTEDGGYMELQAIRYASMVSTMTFEQVADAYQDYLNKRGFEDTDPRQAILDFLGWTEPIEEEFAQDVLIVLVSSNFSKELTTAVLWLNSRNLDIRCVRLQPYKYLDKLLLDIQQVIPLPETSEYQIRVKQKEQSQRDSVSKRWNETTFFEKMKKSQGDELADISKELLEWGRTWSSYIWWGKGDISGSFIPMIDLSDKWYSIFRIDTKGYIQIEFHVLSNRERFKDEQLRLQLMERLNSIEGVDLSSDKIDKKPKIEMQLLTEPQNMKLFKEAVQWAVNIIKDN